MLEVPVICHWDGEVLRPATPYQLGIATERFVVGDLHPIVEQSDREISSHGHYFVRLGEMWKTLPEGMAERFPTREHLRKHALIATGFADKTEAVFETAEQAKLAALIAAPLDTYRVVACKGRVVQVWTAQTQRMRGPGAMAKKDFQASKWAVLNWVADQLRLAADDEHRNPGD